MTLTKDHVIESIYNQCGYSKRKSTKLVESLLEIIKATLGSGENVLITGFGKFSVKEKDQRKGRNPRTGETLFLRQRRVVTFRCSPLLRDKMNGNV
jgi:integration host factor subunit alpha